MPDILQERRGLRFDPTINWGHVAITMALLGSVFWAYVDLQRVDQDFEHRIAAIERSQSDDSDRRRQFESEVRATLQRILQDLAVLKDDRERRL